MYNYTMEVKSTCFQLWVSLSKSFPSLSRSELVCWCDKLRRSLCILRYTCMQDIEVSVILRSHTG